MNGITLLKKFTLLDSELMYFSETLSEIKMQKHGATYSPHHNQQKNARIAISTNLIKLFKYILLLAKENKFGH